MKKIFAFIAVSASLFLSSSAFAQSQPSASPSETRPRSVAPPIVADDPPPVPTVSTTAVAVSQDKTTPAVHQFTSVVIRAKIAEAERLFKSRPRPTSLTTSALDVVTVAVLDRSTSRIHLVSLSKQTFLTRNAELTATTSLGTPVTLRVLRANGVNTALTVVDNAGHSLTPLVS